MQKNTACCRVNIVRFLQLVCTCSHITVLNAKLLFAWYRETVIYYLEAKLC